MQIDPMEEQAAAAAVVVGGAGAGVRVVARICPLDPAATTGSSFQVAAVRRHHHPDPDSSSSSSALLSFVPREDHRSTAASASATGRAATPRKEGGGHKYKLDWCYLQDEPNHHVFRDEVRPLIHHDLSSSSNACVVACGGATANAHLFTGSQDQPGLLTMAMAQILDFSKDIGGAVRVSSYQVLQDSHIFDLLEPKDHEVLILEDADGTTHLKGLSRVDVRSIEEFAQLCCCASNQQKHPTKAPSQLQSRGHQGLIVYVSRFDQQGRECAVSKMNFLNLQGYVDPKRKNNGGGLALPNSHKSMYALMNVVQALNSNQSFVPYRQSKVTRILQDSLRKTSGAVLIACLGELSCQDAVSTVSLASRSSQVVNEQCYSLSMSAKSSLKANEKLCMNAENSSMSFLHSISQTHSVLEKHYRPQFNNSTAKASRTPIANKRSQPIMHSAKKPGCSLSTSIKMKQKDTNPTMSGRKLFSPSTNSSKEDAIVVASTTVKQAEEVQQSLGMEIQAPSTDEGCDETGNVVDTVSSEMQEVVPCSMQELVSSIMQEEDYSSSDLHAKHSCIDLGETCSSNVPDNLAENTPISTTQPSPKLSDQLREISNSLKLLSTRPVSITAQKLDMECVREINTDTPEPKTPAVHLKFGQGEDPKDILKARSTGIKKSLVQECLTFLNSANKEQLKSLKGIGEKRANYILELREESPELFKEIDDLRDIIGMNSKEIKKMMSGIIDS